MKKCPNCGSLVPDDKKICPACQYNFDELNVTKKPSNVVVTRTKKAVIVTGAYFINSENASKMPDYFKVLFIVTAIFCIIAGAVQIGILGYGIYDWVARKVNGEINKSISLLIVYGNAPLLFVCMTLLIIIQAVNCSWINKHGIKKTKSIFLPDIIATGIILGLSIAYPFLVHWFFVIMLAGVFFAPMLIAIGVQLIRNRNLIVRMHKQSVPIRQYTK